jgi:hypothetical protein
MVEVHEILTMWHEGAFSKGDALSWLARIACRDGVERTFEILPSDWREELRQSIFHLYDNDVDADDFVIFGDPNPDRQAFREEVETLRSWIRAQRSEPASK